jgi:hypothetical protein
LDFLHLKLKLKNEKKCAKRRSRTRSVFRRVLMII